MQYKRPYVKYVKEFGNEKHAVNGLGFATSKAKFDKEIAQYRKWGK